MVNGFFKIGLPGLSALAFLMFTAGCSTVSTNFDYDTDFDFTALQSYDWAPAPQEVPGDPLVRRRVEAAVNEQLTEMGYQLTTSNADFHVAVRFGTEDKVDVVNWGYGYGRGWRGGTRDVSVYSYTQGTLILDFADARSHELVWRGTATGVLLSNPTAEERTERINDAVQHLLGGFPPR